LGIAASASLASLAVVSTSSTAKSSDDHVPSLDYGWSHAGFFDAFDAKAIRRGYQVYKEVRRRVEGKGRGRRGSGRLLVL